MKAWIGVVLLASALAVTAQDKLDLSRAIVVSTGNLTSPEQKAIEMLRDEVERRTGIRWEHAIGMPAGGGPVIVAGQAAAVSTLLPAAAAPPTPAESFRTGVASRQVYISGRDPRGVLYGIGHLLRKLEMRRGQVLLPAGYGVSTSPETRLRGHQLGYRPKTNSYDG